MQHTAATVVLWFITSYRVFMLSYLLSFLLDYNVIKLGGHDTSSDDIIIRSESTYGRFAVQGTHSSLHRAKPDVTPAT